MSLEWLANLEIQSLLGTCPFGVNSTMHTEGVRIFVVLELGMSTLYPPWATQLVCA